MKHLDKDIDHKALHETFSTFGNILCSACRGLIFTYPSAPSFLHLPSYLNLLAICLPNPNCSSPLSAPAFPSISARGLASPYPRHHHNRHPILTLVPPPQLLLPVGSGHHWSST